MATKATHTGECQICGNRQMLPSGVLAKHGYTTRWGFFAGTCPGSGHLPYELSCDRIQLNIDRVKAEAANLRSVAADARKQDDPSACWTHPYIRAATRYAKDGYHWRLSEIRRNPAGHGLQQLVQHDVLVDFRWTKVGKWERLDVYGDGLYDHDKGSYLLDRVALHLNDVYAKHLEREAAQCDAYVAWATPRVTGWKLKPLTPRKAA